MRYLDDPRQTKLFDVFEGILSPVAYRKLQGRWQHLFRTVILSRLPAGKLAEHFDPEMGRPTKELYSMAGLLFVMEFWNWTHKEAADAYMYNMDLQYLLNLQPENQSLCRRTIERYIRLFREDELAQDIMQDVTEELVKRLELNVTQQCLDSTHIESNMAKFGRIRLMATVIRQFLAQVRRHDEAGYCREQGIDLISPTSGQCPKDQADPNQFTTADFLVVSGERVGDWGLVEPNPQCVAYPAGTAPHR